MACLSRTPYLQCSIYCFRQKTGDSSWQYECPSPEQVIQDFERLGQFKHIDTEFLQQYDLYLFKDIIIYCGNGIKASVFALTVGRAKTRVQYDKWCNV